MSTIDASGAIHAADGRFSGHVAGEADDVCLVDVPEIDSATADVERAALDAAGDLDVDLNAARDDAISRLTDAGLAPDQALDTWDSALRKAFRVLAPDTKSAAPERKKATTR